jgi:hypothetical protein
MHTTGHQPNSSEQNRYLISESLPKTRGLISTSLSENKDNLNVATPAKRFHAHKHAHKQFRTGQASHLRITLQKQRNNLNIPRKYG